MKTNKLKNIAIALAAACLFMSACDDGGSSSGGSSVPSFVAVGEDGAIFISNNGTTWTDQTQSGGTLLAVTYGNMKYVAVGTSGRILISDDGKTWANKTQAGANFTDIAYGNSTFVAVGNSGRCSVSGDGESWSNITSIGGTPTFGEITFANNMFLATGYRIVTTEPLLVHDVIYSSTDGEEWTQEFSSELIDDNFIGSAFANDIFIAVTVEGIVYTSDDNGDTWDSGTSIADCDYNSINNVASGNNRFLATGQYITELINNVVLTSSNGSTWSNIAPTVAGSGAQVLSIIDTQDLFVVAGSHEYIAISDDDGISWDTVHSSTEDISLYDVTYGGY